MSRRAAPNYSLKRTAAGWLAVLSCGRGRSGRLAQALGGKLELAARILAPDQDRAPVYDSMRSRHARSFAFACAGCASPMELDLPSYISHYSDRESVLGPSQSEAIRLHYCLPDSKSLAGGWPKFRVEYCAHCNVPYLVYVSVHEPANGWYQVVPQGITRLAT